jgi:hypothetical protein
MLLQIFYRTHIGFHNDEPALQRNGLDSAEVRMAPLTIPAWLKLNL